MTQARSTNGDASSALVPALVLFGGITLILIALLASRPVVPVTETVAAVPTTVESVNAGPTATPQPIVVAQAQTLDPVRVSSGSNIYSSTCSACHGFNAMGIPGLGKTLIGSEFVNSMSDEELVAFIKVGRQVTDPLNTTGVMMPANGGNPTLDDEKLLDVVSYIRSLNTEKSTSAAVAPTAVPTAAGGTPAPTSEPVAFAPINVNALVAPTSIAGETNQEAAEPTSSPETSDVSAAPADGGTLYNQNCAGCHGLNGEGVSMVAQPLVNSQMFNDRDGTGLIQFLSAAVQTESGFPHPERGGNLALTDEDIQAIIIYMYSLPGQ